MSESEILGARLATIVALVEKKHPLGRTAVMKLCYFLQALRSVQLGYRFRLYSYGPFDARVLSDISTAETLGGIESKTVLYPSGYGYEISPAANTAFVKGLGSDFITQNETQIDWVVERFGGLASAELELLSTIVYVDREYAQARAKQTKEGIAEKVREIKPHFGLSDVLMKVGNLEQQGLLKSLRTASR
jgi:hypothetical protein